MAQYRETSSPYASKTPCDVEITPGCPVSTRFAHSLQAQSGTDSVGCEPPQIYPFFEQSTSHPEHEQRINRTNSQPHQFTTQTGRSRQKNKIKNIEKKKQNEFVFPSARALRAGTEPICAFPSPRGLASPHNPTHESATTSPCVNGRRRHRIPPAETKIHAAQIGSRARGRVRADQSHRQTQRAKTKGGETRTAGNRVPSFFLIFAAAAAPTPPARRMLP